MFRIDSSNKTAWKTILGPCTNLRNWLEMLKEICVLNSQALSKSNIWLIFWQKLHPALFWTLVIWSGSTESMWLSTLVFSTLLAMHYCHVYFWGCHYHCLFILIHPHGHAHVSFHRYAYSQASNLLFINHICMNTLLDVYWYKKVVQGLRVNCDEAGGRSEPKAKPLCASHCEPSHAIIIIIVSVLVIIMTNHDHHEW